MSHGNVIMRDAWENHGNERTPPQLSCCTVGWAMNLNCSLRLLARLAGTIKNGSGYPSSALPPELSLGSSFKSPLSKPIGRSHPSWPTLLMGFALFEIFRIDDDLFLLLLEDVASVDPQESRDELSTHWYFNWSRRRSWIQWFFFLLFKVSAVSVNMSSRQKLIRKW
jgi:hypothetical protein